MVVIVKVKDSSRTVHIQVPKVTRVSPYLNTFTALYNTLGNPIPAFTGHVISVPLPEWTGNVGYEEGEARVLDVMQTGYPRFFIHVNIARLPQQTGANTACKSSLPSLLNAPRCPSQLSSLLEQKFSTLKETSLLFPSRKSAEACRAFLAARGVITASVVQLCISDCLSIFPVFPETKSALGRQFWQHTGLGVSSRFATRVLAAGASPADPDASQVHGPLPLRPQDVALSFELFF